jgi:hypothetical protein
MVIIAPDASEMAQTAARAIPAAGEAAIRPEAAQPAKADLHTPPDNKVETIQSVLRHFLGETDGSGLGKS